MGKQRRIDSDKKRPNEDWYGLKIVQGNCGVGKNMPKISFFFWINKNL